MSEEFHPKELYRHPLQQVLERIATAFEEQNRMNQEWIDLQVKWHEAGDPIGKRIVEIHEEDAQKAQAWREHQRQTDDLIHDLVHQTLHGVLSHSGLQEVKHEHTE